MKLVHKALELCFLGIHVRQEGNGFDFGLTQMLATFPNEFDPGVHLRRLQEGARGKWLVIVKCSMRFVHPIHEQEHIADLELQRGGQARQLTASLRPCSGATQGQSVMHAVEIPAETFLVARADDEDLQADLFLADPLNVCQLYLERLGSVVWQRNMKQEGGPFRDWMLGGDLEPVERQVSDQSVLVGPVARDRREAFDGLA